MGTMAGTNYVNFKIKLIYVRRVQLKYLQRSATDAKDHNRLQVVPILTGRYK